MADIRPITHRITSDHEAVYAGHVRRVAAIDPLVRVPPYGVAAGEPVLVARAGDAAAVGRVRLERHAAASEQALWGPCRQVSLTPHVVGQDAELAWDRLLSRWCASLPEVVEPGDLDSGAVVALASHDIVLARPLLLHGFAASLVVAVRRRRLPGTPRPVRDARVRPAAEGDLEAMVDLALALYRHDASFGMVTDRASARQTLRTSLLDHQHHSPGWSWVVLGSHGQVAGFVVAYPPENAGWAASMVAAEPVGYLGYLYVRPAARGAGIGSALVAAAHRALDDRGVGATLLHHALPSPLSTPFWARHGYRPLWTTWLRRPAVPRSRR